MSKKQKLLWLLMNVRRVRFGLYSQPLFTVRLAWRRLLFFTTRRFVGKTLKSPVTGEHIFNIQSLINYWAMHCINELGSEWQNGIRETASPVIFDCGSNLCQFSKLALSIHPKARIITIDAWPEMKFWALGGDHVAAALSNSCGGRLTLGKSTDGLTASTKSNYYKGQTIEVKTKTLDSIWSKLGKPFVDLLKIDIDGSEIDALKGARKMLKSVKMILIETESIEEVKLLCPGRRWSTSNNFDWLGIL